MAFNVDTVAQIHLPVVYKFSVHGNRQRPGKPARNTNPYVSYSLPGGVHVEDHRTDVLWAYSVTKAAWKTELYDRGEKMVPRKIPVRDNMPDLPRTKLPHYFAVQAALVYINASARVVTSGKDLLTFTESASRPVSFLHFAPSQRFDRTTNRYGQWSDHHAIGAVVLKSAGGCFTITSDRARACVWGSYWIQTNNDSWIPITHSYYLSSTLNAYLQEGIVDVNDAFTYVFNSRVLSR